MSVIFYCRLLKFHCQICMWQAFFRYRVA